MASLAEKTSKGLPSWEVYIQKNPLWRTLKFQLDTKYVKEIKDSPTFLLKEAAGRLVPDIQVVEKSVIQITSDSIVNKNNLRLARVRVDNREGLLPINRIKKPTGISSTTKVEDNTISMLDRKIKEIGFPSTVVLESDGVIRHKYENIIGARKVLGTPKADFSLFDTLGRDLVFISHKADDGRGARSFQQYSGVTVKSGIPIFRHPEVQDFLKVAAMFVEDGYLKNPIYRRIKDPLLVSMAIFGPDYKQGSQNYGRDFCQVLGQGNPLLVPTQLENTFKLSFSTETVLVHRWRAKDIRYTPVLGARRASDRGIQMDNFFLRGVRPGVFTLAGIQTYSGVQEI